MGKERSWKPEWALAIVRFSLQQEALLGTAGSLRVYQTMEIGPRAKVKKEHRVSVGYEHRLIQIL